MVVTENLENGRFSAGLRAGIRLFFGVRCDNSKLICDHHFPEFFDEWRANQREKESRTSIT
jgi:hypothetical protein